MTETLPTEAEGLPDGLTSTAFAVLGILAVNDEELSVGEIKTRATYGMRFFYWSPAVSHIRRELRRLLELGLVEEREIVIGKVRRSQLYQTTAAGEDVLLRWVTREDVDEPVVVKNSALLRVFLGARAPLDVVLAVLDARADRVAADIEDHVWGRRRAAELGILEQENLQLPAAVAEYTLRALYFEQANLRQLRDRVVGLDREAFRRDVRRTRGSVRRRHEP